VNACAEGFKFVLWLAAVRLLKRPCGAGVRNYLLQFDPIEEVTDVVRYGVEAGGGLIPWCVGCKFISWAQYLLINLFLKHITR
jgi:hypothetical protein